MDIISRIFGSLFDFLGFFLNAVGRNATRTQITIMSENEMMLGATPAGLALFTATISPAPGLDTGVQPMVDRAHQQIDALQKIDPDFNEVAFLDYAAGAYTKSLNAEGAMDVSVAQDVLTPANSALLTKRISDWKDQGFRRVVSDVKLDGVTLFKVTLDGVSQALAVRMAGSAVRYTQDLSSGIASDGSLKSESFIEFATFVRPAGAITPKTAQLGGPTHCPSCGAPAPMSGTRCPFCGSPLTPAGAPWLLDHVSQSAYT